MGCCGSHVHPQITLGWFLSFRPIQPTVVVWAPTSFNSDSLSPCVCSTSGLFSNCVTVGTSIASGLHPAVISSHPVPSLPNKKALLLPPSVTGWGSILLRPTTQVLPETLPCGPAAHSIRVFCFLPPHAHLAFQIQLCPEDDNRTHPSCPWGTTLAARSAFKIQIIHSCSSRRA